MKRLSIGAVVVAGLWALACGGGPVQEPAFAAPIEAAAPIAAPAPAAADTGMQDLRFTKWKCFDYFVEFQAMGRCTGSSDPDWTCTFEQKGNFVTMTWTPGPKTAKGNEVNTWEGEIIDVVTMGGVIKQSNWQGDWRCSRRF